MDQKGRNANGTTTTTHARHFPHNNIDKGFEDSSKFL